MLPVITVCQFASTSVWFAVNGVMGDLQRELDFPLSAVGTLTSSVQVGFILGSLAFAVTAFADRFSPRLIFLISSLVAAALTAAATVLPPSMAMLLVLRCATGACLAGIYPIGMKIASQWYARAGGLGAALGILIGALMLGTAAPHAVRALGASWPWQRVMLAIAALAAAGGVALFCLLPEAPAAMPAAAAPPPTAAPAATALALAQTPGSSVAASSQPPPVSSPSGGLHVGEVWRAIAHDPRVRASVLGYLGHCTELYVFWTLVPAIIAAHGVASGSALSWAAFTAIALGAAGSVIGSFAVRRYGSARVACTLLATSGACCLLSIFAADSGDWVFWPWLMLWGATISGDSPQFSALTVANAPKAIVGSVLTLVNCAGYIVIVLSVELFTALASAAAEAKTPDANGNDTAQPLAGPSAKVFARLLPWLAIGPALGLFAMRTLLKEPPPAAVQPAVVQPAVVQPAVARV